MVQCVWDHSRAEAKFESFARRPDLEYNDVHGETDLCISQGSFA